MSLPKVAYFSMEMPIDQSLYTYSGGLGYLAGSHMHSAGKLDLPLVGVTMLWTHGYGIQVINEKNEVELQYNKREYPFLKNTGITVVVEVFGKPVRVKAFLLEAETFDTAPVYLLTTDIPENSEEHRKISHVLYDGDQKTRIAQEIVLGIGGLRVLRAAAEHINVIHLNEGHALPAGFELLDEFHGNLDEVKERLVFTTHTPVAAGNESHNAHLLAEAGFFGKTDVHRAIELGGEDFSLTVAALRMSRTANGVSQLHGEVANNMWNWVHGRAPIKAITNAVNNEVWQDKRVTAVKKDGKALLKLKKEMKQELFDYIEKEKGVKFDPDVLTIVWARRFTEYKRAWLLFSDEERILDLLKNKKIQLIYSGKFHPLDTAGHNAFNEMLANSKKYPNMVVLPNYELELSGLLKRGSDIWLNNPLRPMEASGTSGMSANMNGCLHFSTYDGWAVEGTFHDINGYLINADGNDEYLPIDDRHKQDYESMMSTLEENILPTYYDNPKRWSELMIQAIQTADAFFNSDRMVIEYYNRLYKPVTI